MRPPHERACIAALLEGFAGGLPRLQRVIESHRGDEITLTWPSGYTLALELEENCVLTNEDLQLWRHHPLMSSGFLILGTLGQANGWVWDRRVVAVNGNGCVFSREIRQMHYVLRLADSLEEFLRLGIGARVLRALWYLRDSVLTAQGRSLPSNDALRALGLEPLAPEAVPPDSEAAGDDSMESPEDVKPPPLLAVEEPSPSCSNSDSAPPLCRRLRPLPGRSHRCIRVTPRAAARPRGVSSDEDDLRRDADFRCSLAPETNGGRRPVTRAFAAGKRSVGVGTETVPFERMTCSARPSRATRSTTRERTAAGATAAPRREPSPETLDDPLRDLCFMSAPSERLGEVEWDVEEDVINTMLDQCLHWSLF